MTGLRFYYGDLVEHDGPDDPEVARARLLLERLGVELGAAAYELPSLAEVAHTFLGGADETDVLEGLFANPLVESLDALEEQILKDEAAHEADGDLG